MRNLTVVLLDLKVDNNSTPQIQMALEKKVDRIAKDTIQHDVEDKEISSTVYPGETRMRCWRMLMKNMQAVLIILPKMAKKMIQQNLNLSLG